MTSNNICKVAEFDDAVFYKATCSCQSDDHTQTLVLEHDPEMCDITLSIYSEVYSNNFWKYYDTWFARIGYWFVDKWIRVKFATFMLFHGYIKVENSFIFRNEAAVVDYIQALTDGLEKVRIAKLNRNKKNAS